MRLPVLMTLGDYADAGFPDSDNVLILFTDDSPGVQDRLDAVVADLPVVTVKDQAEFAQEQREPIDQFVLMIFALLGLALVIAVLGIVNTLALSVIERTREVGLLRAIGRQPRPAAADDHAGVGGDRRARRGARAWCWASGSGSR